MPSVAIRTSVVKVTLSPSVKVTGLVSRILSPKKKGYVYWGLGEMKEEKQGIKRIESLYLFVLKDGQNKEFFW